MTNIKEKDFNVKFEMRAIEILKSNFNVPLIPDFKIAIYNYQLRVESKINAEHKMVFVWVDVGVKNEDGTIDLADMTISCNYYIENFEELIRLDERNEATIPDSRLTELLNSISVSTMRGVMFSTFRGTYLNNAILPIIDPKQFEPIA